MNQMEIFKNPEFGSIRTFEQDGKVLFCGTDVATALGYANPRKAVRDHTRCGTKCSIGRRLPPHCPQQAALGGAV